MEIMRCVKFIRCPIWFQSMLSNANLIERGVNRGFMVFMIFFVSSALNMSTKIDPDCK